MTRPATPGVRPRPAAYDRADMKAALWERFYRESRRGRAWKGCENCPPERRDPAAILESHHVVDQTDIKDLTRDAPLLRIRLLTDPANTMLVDALCHHGHTSRMNPLRLAAIRTETWEFIRGLDERFGTDLLGKTLEDYRS